MQNISQTKNSKQTIVTAADNSFVDFLSVLLMSLKINNQGSFEVFILNDGLNKETEAKLKRISNNSFELYFIYIPDFKNKISFSSQLTDPHFWRLIATHFLHDKERILYIDADTMVRKDISELFSMYQTKKTISASIDYLEKVETGISNWKDFNFNPENYYFNSGVLLINNERFIEKKIAEQVIEITEKYLRYTKACNKWQQYDQYGLNVVLYDDWFNLPNIYNYGSELEFKDAEIVHFNGHGKPTSNSCTAQYKNEFYNYLNKVTNPKNQSIIS